MKMDPATPTGGAPSDDESYPRGRQVVITLGLLCLVSAMLTMDVSLVGLLIEPVKHDLRLTDGQLGILQGPASSLAYAAFAIPMGILVDRLNRVKMVLLATFFWTAAIFVMAYSDSFWVFVAAKILIGIVMAVLLTAPFTIIADLLPPRGRAGGVTYLVIGQYLGGALGFLVGGLVFDWFTRSAVTTGLPLLGDLSPWRASFVVFGALGVLLLPFLLLMREPERKERRVQRPDLRAQLKELHAYRGFLWPIYLGYALQVITDSSIRAWLSPALMRLYDLTPGQFGGWVGATVLLGGITGSAMGGWFAEQSRRRDGTMIVVVITCVVLAASSCLALMPTVTGLVALFVVGTLANGVLATMVSAMLITYVPNELRGLSSGILILVAVGPGLAIGPVLVPAVSSALGGPMQLGLAMALVGVPAALLSAVAYGFARTGARADRPA